MCQFLRMVCMYIRIIFDKTVDFFFSLHWESKKEAIPDLDKNHAFLAESAVSLARKIKSKELKSEDLVKAVIERIKQVNPILNAITEERYEAALSEARDIDNLIAMGLSDEAAKKKPFLGVPFTTKESQAMKGMRLTMGLLCRKDKRSQEDSESVLRLRAAGAIPVATTNLPELLVWQETRNMIYGMTKNPHHTGRTPGGSSGAEAALTASYATPISLCSDLGGSTRMPAFYCGMFGHHPTPGATNLRGVFFRTGDSSDDDSMFSLGFISKHVEDLAPLTKIVAGDKAERLKLDREVNIKDIKFYYLEEGKDCHVSPIRPELRSVMNRVISKISENVTSTANGPQPYEHEGFGHMYQLWSYCMSKEPGDFAEMCTDGNGKACGFIELAKKAVGMSKHCMSVIVRLLEQKTIPLYPDWAERLTIDLKSDLFSKLGENGVLILPSAPLPAPYHYSAFLRPFNFAYWAIANVLKCPAVQVPLGVNADGLPIGIQVLSAPNNDALCLAVAKYLESTFGGAVMSCKIKQ